MINTIHINSSINNSYLEVFLTLFVSIFQDSISLDLIKEN